MAKNGEGKRGRTGGAGRVGASERKPAARAVRGTKRPGEARGQAEPGEERRTAKPARRGSATDESEDGRTGERARREALGKAVGATGKQMRRGGATDESEDGRTGERARREALGKEVGATGKPVRRRSGRDEGEDGQTGERTRREATGDANTERPASAPREAGRSRPTRTGPDERRAALLAAAYATIADRGLEGLRTREVAARAGVNIATLHYHFGSKEALLVAVIAHVRDKFVAASQERGGGRGLAAHLTAAGETFREDRQLGRVLGELVLRGQRDRAARAAFRALHEFWAAMVESILRDEMARGELRPDVDARAGARVLTSFVIGAMTQLGVHAKAFEFAAVAGELARWLAPPPRRAR
ncbi:TetR family transcriptional regulator [Nannocystis punicea]|uniref:TetR family transcriptional regulator n=1 Tax=Nannocystis punicea TaxID=2995304 RepID=A0ABY7HAL9_9BACT|nr:TetR family transcriptional regulator [Nannocystis poenicansa]WAS96152.1 TetR family transcriptional regulator [Nannocystis poenicansa]